jgi:hypothetical protein
MIASNGREIPGPLEIRLQYNPLSYQFATHRFPPEIRSRIMSAIRGRDTGPERDVRRILRIVNNPC